MSVYLNTDFQYAMLIKREALQTLKKALARQAAVALIGPRQVGKTTLALEIGRELDAI